MLQYGPYGKSCRKDKQSVIKQIRQRLSGEIKPGTVTPPAALPAAIDAVKGNFLNKNLFNIPGS